MPRTSLSRLLEGFSRQGRDLIRRYAPFAAVIEQPGAVSSIARMEGLALDLLSGRGEASGIAIAADFLNVYREASESERRGFFRRLAERFGPDEADLDRAYKRYKTEGQSALSGLSRAIEAPRQELFRRLNLAPGGTEALVRMRADLLAALPSAGGALDCVDLDLAHLLQSWFNRGFLTFTEIDWSSSASLLERVIQYEAVHNIDGWSDLRRRLDPADRRCFAIFHPAMAGEPLIFVEVALTEEISDSIQSVLRIDRSPIAAESATTAVFYSISNCQPGLRGISFGNFLIKQVASDLKRGLPQLTSFVTLSPIPGFMTWLRKEHPPLAGRIPVGEPPSADLKAILLPLAARYLAEAKGGNGRPIDPVARFHLGNGARLDRLNWHADISANGLKQSAGMMVNYYYDLPAAVENHEAFVSQGTVALGKPIRAMLRSAQYQS